MLVKDLFNLKYGIPTSGLDISEKQTSYYNLPLFRPSQSFENVVVGYVNKDKVPASLIFPSETLFVSTNGQGSHSYTYVSNSEFIPNSDVTVLIPKKTMSLNAKIYFSLCIKKNRWLFSYGRKPKGVRLENLSLPNKIPKWVSKAVIENKTLKFKVNTKNKIPNSNLVKVSDIFEVIYGSNLALNKLTKISKADDNSVNFVSRTDRNNGISATVKRIKDKPPIPAGVLTVAVGGSVLETFIQMEPFYSGRDIYYLKPKYKMSLTEKMFYAFCIRANKYRYTYNRQANRTLKDIQIPKKLPKWANSINLDKLLSQYNK